MEELNQSMNCPACELVCELKKRTWKTKVTTKGVYEGDFYHYVCANDHSFTTQESDEVSISTLKPKKK